MVEPLHAADDRIPASTPYRPLMWVAVAAGLGIVADYYLTFARGGGLFGGWWAAAIISWVLAAAARRRQRWNWAAAGLLCTAAATGGLWRHWCWDFASTDDLVRFARDEPQPTCVEAVIDGRIEVSPPADSSPLRAMPARTMSEATVAVTKIRDGKRWRTASGLSRLRVAGVLRGVASGDRVLVFAQFAKPAPPLNPGEYDWAAAERRQWRLTELYCENPRCVSVVDPARSLGVVALLSDLRRWCERQLTANIDPADAPLVLATLLGEQSRLSESTKDAFLKTGSIHLLVVSGAHVALLAAMVWLLARGMAVPRFTQLMITVAAVVVYAAIVGPQPSVVRAAILTVSTLAALAIGRNAPAGNLLGTAALGVMAYNPCEIFRAGTQFSFLAVAVLIAFARWKWPRAKLDPLERLIDEARPWPAKAARRFTGWLLAMTAASLVVGVAMAPLVAYHFNVVTPASILITPVAGPLIAVALGAGLGVITIGWLIPPLSAVLGWLCGGSLRLTESLVVFAQSIPGSYFYSPGFPTWWLWGFYGTAGVLIALPWLRPRGAWIASAAMIWLAIGYASVGLERQSTDGELRCTFLSVGHGCCTVLELPGGQTMLYDAGSLGSPDAVAKTIASYLWSRGIDRIDAVVLSHADIDHYNAMPGLIERFPIGAVYVSPMMFDPIATGGDLTAPNYLRDVLYVAGVPMREIWMNDRLQTGDANVTIDVLHPPREGVFGRDNANSLLLSVEFAGTRVLLPGDLESPGIERVMADPPLDCDVLLAPHHGSPLSDPPGFAAWSTPEFVIMSGERPGRTLLAQGSYQAAGATVLHTAVKGAISFAISPDAATMEKISVQSTK